jgi:hypothetical protein
MKEGYSTKKQHRFQACRHKHVAVRSRKEMIPRWVKHFDKLLNAQQPELQHSSRQM